MSNCFACFVGSVVFQVCQKSTVGKCDIFFSVAIDTGLWAFCLWSCFGAKFGRRNSTSAQANAQNFATTKLKQGLFVDCTCNIDLFDDVVFCDKSELQTVGQDCKNNKKTWRWQNEK